MDNTQGPGPAAETEDGLQSPVLAATSPPRGPAAPPEATDILSKEEREAALKKGALEETEEQIMFSCNICYDVRHWQILHRETFGCWNRRLVSWFAACIRARCDTMWALVLLAVLVSVVASSEPLPNLSRLQGWRGEGQGWLYASTLHEDATYPALSLRQLPVAPLVHRSFQSMAVAGMKTHEAKTRAVAAHLLQQKCPSDLRDSGLRQSCGTL